MGERTRTDLLATNLRLAGTVEDLRETKERLLSRVDALEFALHAAFGALMAVAGDRDGCVSPGVKAFAEDHAAQAKAALLISDEECDQCGARRQSWQRPDSEWCPNHANPNGSCDGVLRRPQ